MRLASSTVVVTGASGGIGSALTRQLVARGARVIAVGRRAGALADVRDTLPENLRDRVVPLVADVASAIGRERVVRAARAAAHPVRLLVHAAASASFEAFERTDDAQLSSLFETNVMAPFALTRDLLPLLRDSRDAAVVAIGSTFGSLAYPGYAAYSASKFALRGLFEALAREHADGPVRFQWLAPRATRTPFNAARVERMNAELGVAMDDPDSVAARLVEAIESGRARLQIGWPERLFVRINALFPSLVDRSLRKQLPVVHRHLADTVAAPAATETRLTTGVTP